MGPAAGATTLCMTRTAADRITYELLLDEVLDVRKRSGQARLAHEVQVDAPGGFPAL
jgi:hypothetical protein